MAEYNKVFFGATHTGHATLTAEQMLPKIRQRCGGANECRSARKPDTWGRVTLEYALEMDGVSTTSYPFTLMALPSKPARLFITTVVPPEAEKEQAILIREALGDDWDLMKLDDAWRERHVGRLAEKHTQWQASGA